MKFRCVTAAGSGSSIQKDKNGQIIGKGIYFETFEELKRMLNFTYSLDSSPDGQYGSLHENGSWNGMVRYLKDDIFDIGMCSISGLGPDHVQITTRKVNCKFFRISFQFTFSLQFTCT